MQPTLRCPSCTADLLVPETPAAPNLRCPRCGNVVDSDPSTERTALTVAPPVTFAPGPQPRIELEDNLPADLRVLIRPDPLHGIWTGLLATVLIGMCILSNGVQAYLSFERAWQPPHNHQLQVRHLDFKDRFGLAANRVQLLTAPAAALGFFFWLYFASANLRALQSVGMAHTPGLAILHYFIPLFNLYRPHVTMQEIWRGSDPDAIGSSLAWIDAPRSGLVRAWWLTFVGAAGLGMLAHYWERLPVALPRSDFAWMWGFSHVGMMIAGVLVIVIIQQITIRQRERYERLYAE
jgi:hypothetical protein